MIPDELCPECHGAFELLRVLRASLVKRCKECGHEWHEERSEMDVIIRKGNYIDRDE